MSDSISLVLPADAQYLALAPQVAAKYTELAGGTEAEGGLIAGALSATLAEIAAGASRDAVVALTLRAGNGGVEIGVRCGDRTSLVRQPLPVRKSS
jgi:hypothetical protein